ncbi:hypothetical protein [Embleya scabrispora]|uniref:hypothetical protein n=1 Tax=Embleya scabrispora TaxID=159449 RepID=UPI001FDEDBB7|nr:hypothetical protein [Embleya scabrispora]
MFNEAPNRVTADARVRWALVAALDLKQLGAVATGGKGVAATRLGTTMTPPCPTDSITANLPPHDVTRAAEALRAAGWKRSRCPRPIRTSRSSPGPSRPRASSSVPSTTPSTSASRAWR